MSRSSNRLAAALVALLLTATPAVASSPTEQAPAREGNTIGWLQLMAGSLQELIGHPESRHAATVSDPASPDEKPSSPTGGSSTNPEADDGPDWDPNG